MADKIVTVPRKLISAKPFGCLGTADLERLDLALRFWLSLP